MLKHSTENTLHFAELSVILPIRIAIDLRNDANDQYFDLCNRIRLYFTDDLQHLIKFNQISIV
jgi:hypothetical protein